MKNKIIKFLLLFLSFSIHALPFNSNLNQKEKETLLNGEILIKNIKNSKNISLESENHAVSLLINTIKDLNPNYLAEIIQVRDIKNNENLMTEMRSALENISDYVGIPYISSAGGLYELYSKADIISHEKISDTVTMYKVEFFMEPFGTIFAIITIEQTEDYIFYKMINTSKLKFKGITAVNPEKMANCVILFKEDDKWILYGTGGIKSVRVPFFETKIEGSFMNRIRTFCKFIFNKI